MPIRARSPAFFQVSVGVPAETRVTSHVLFTKNATVWIITRDKSKGEAILRELSSTTGKDAHLLLMDLANLKSIKAAAEEFLRNVNASVTSGVTIPPMTEDGCGLQFGTNVLGRCYFTKLVLPLFSLPQNGHQMVFLEL
ncbi:hypothetical protein BU15DRAFT_65343 [Melanogaster broomeanus]|nr:hypothetical protein BU15DRAFT_65343 [Melanogaster broomeanus]